MKKLLLNILKANFYLISMLSFINPVYADPLSPDKAFHFVPKLENSSIMIYGTTQTGYKLYKDNIKIINDKSTVSLNEMIKPAGKRQYNEFLNKYQEEYEGDFLLEIPFKIIDKKKSVVEFDLEAQGCTKGLCYSPFLTHIKLSIK